jgi:copper homeostasis protein CutC
MSGLYFYVKVLVDGRIRITHEEMPEVIVENLEKLNEWLSVFGERPQLIWGAGFGAENDAYPADNLPLPNLNTASLATMRNSKERWEYAANHPESAEWATDTYVQIATAYGKRFGK